MVWRWRCYAAMALRTCRGSPFLWRPEACQQNPCAHRQHAPACSASVWEGATRLPWSAFNCAWSFRVLIARCLRAQRTLGPPGAAEVDDDQRSRSQMEHNVLRHYLLCVVKYEMKWPSQRHLRLQIYSVVWSVCKC